MITNFLLWRLAWPIRGVRTSVMLYAMFSSAAAYVILFNHAMLKLIEVTLGRATALLIVIWALVMLVSFFILLDSVSEDGETHRALISEDRNTNKLNAIYSILFAAIMAIQLVYLTVKMFTN